MSNKRARFMEEDEPRERMYNLSIDQNGNIPADTKDITVMTITDNSKIKRITNIKKLTVLNCINTELNCITNCESLYRLKLKNDRGLTDLSLNDMNKIKISNCVVSKLCLRRIKKVSLIGLHNLTFVRLIDVHTLILNNINLLVLEQLRFMAPNTQELIVENCDITFLCDFLKGSSVSVIKVKNCKGGKDIINMKTRSVIELLSFKNCKDISIISNIHNINSLTVNNCLNLRRISTIRNARNVSVYDCDKLRAIDELDNIDLLSVKRCNSVIRLNNSINAKKIESINNFGMKSICIDEYLKHLYIVNNTNLEDLEYDNLYSDSGLNLSIIGETCIRTIESWCAKTLYIKDNSNIDFIGYVQGLHVLKLENLPNLESIEDFYIHHKLWISDCDNLLNISNLYGFDNLKLNNCISLQSVNIGFSKVKRMELRHLPLVKLHIRATALENLYINCVELVTLYDYNHNINISAMNTSFLDRGISYMEKCFAAAKKIAKFIRYRNDKKNYKTFTKACVNNDPCSICYESFNQQDYDDCIITHCNHVYHKKCLAEWMKRRSVCPLCLSNLNSMIRIPRTQSPNINIVPVLTRTTFIIDDRPPSFGQNPWLI